MDPQDYATRIAYRPPTRRYRLLAPLAVGLIRLGAAPKDAVVLRVRGRRSGKRRSTPVLLTRHGGHDYLVSLAGESHWVRNVRAAGGEASLCRRGEQRVRLVEIDGDERAAVIAEYLKRTTTRPRHGRPDDTVARRYFGLGPAPRAEEVHEIAPYYPVFRADATPSPSRST